MSELYPLKFKPIFKEKIWGGQKIKTILGKDFGNLENCGESWEISGVANNLSIVANGLHANKTITDLIQTYGAKLLGKNVYSIHGDTFPLLIKFIDAAQDLSIQVHPDDQLANERHKSPGKTEMWYIIDSDPAASLITGFEKETNVDEFLEYLQSGKLLDLLHEEPANPGDVFFLPAGRVHTIGKGLLLAEIQQTSDITYRIHDFDRVDKFGKKRDLHIEEALAAIDFTKPSNYKTRYENGKEGSSNLVESRHFVTNRLTISESRKRNTNDLDSFVIYIVVSGKGSIQNENVSFGEVILIPASIKEFEIETDGHLELLETYIP